MGTPKGARSCRRWPATASGNGVSPGPTGLTDGRHLGCGGSCSSSRRGKWCGPWLRMRRAGVPMRKRGAPSGALHRARPLRHVVFRARRSLPFAGVGLAWWDRERRRSPAGWMRGVIPMTQVRGGLGVSPSDVWQCRSLQPALQRSHDERCPSGSGWGSGVSRPPARVKRAGNCAWMVERGCWQASMPAPGPWNLGWSRRCGWMDRLTSGCPAGPGGMGGLPPSSPGGDGAIRSPGWWSRRRARLRPSVAGAKRSRGSEAGGRKPVSEESEDRAIPRVCSRAALVAEVDERRTVQPKRPWV